MRMKGKFVLNTVGTQRRRWALVPHRVLRVDMKKEELHPESDTRTES